MSEAADPARLRADATYWITGGQGALGLLVAQRLALLGARHIVLTGRSRGVPSAVEQAIAELRRGGINVVVRPGDVAVRAEALEILDDIRRNLPALAGVFHAAGVVQDGVLLRQSWESFATVLAPKVAGSWNLHELTRDQALDHFVMFSSAAGLLGSSGQASYAAANAFLDALSHHRRRLGLPAVSIAWGPWANVGMAAASDAQRNIYRRQLLRPMPVDEALGQFERILGGADPNIAVLSIDWGAVKGSIRSLFQSGGPQASILSELIQAQDLASDPSPGLVNSTEKRGSRADGLRAMLTSERGRALAAYVRDQLRDMLELGVETPLDSKMPLVEFGLESLTALSLRNRFSHDLGLNLPSTLLYSHPTVDALAQYFESQLFPETQRGAANAHVQPQADGIQSQFGEMSLVELAGQLEDRISKILGEENCQ
jgi:NAD(P)-dependent dehydrogenase (short-subunit alcohol dehydrogenase family)/aryl carrier-like protein